MQNVWRVFIFEDSTTHHLQQNCLPALCLNDCITRYACPYNSTNCESKFCSAAAGYSRPFLSINRQLPSPLVCACEGDIIEVNVYNGLLETADSATIHWLGMWQHNTPFMDGTPYVSQCPIPPEQSFQYKFEAFPPGTHWYHSHLGIQRYDGVAGPLIVMPRGNRTDLPETIDDPEQYAIFVQDWLNKDTGQRQEMDMAFGFLKQRNYGTPESLLINGKGFVDSKPFKPLKTGNGTHYATIPPELFVVEQGKYYRF